MTSVQHAYLEPASYPRSARRSITLRLFAQGKAQRITLYPYNFDQSTICIVNALGQVMLREPAQQLTPNLQVKLPDAGLYFIEASDGFYHEIKECRLDN